MLSLSNDKLERADYNHVIGRQGIGPVRILPIVPRLKQKIDLKEASLLTHRSCTPADILTSDPTLTHLSSYFRPIPLPPLFLLLLLLLRAPIKLLPAHTFF